MRSDVHELLDFYARPIGGLVRRILSRHIRRRWSDVKGQTIMGLGFASPYLAPFRGEALRLGALMPSAQGAVVWPATGPVHTVVVEDEQLPLPDNSVDKLLVIHCLESSGNVRGLLREIWRVLRPEGRVLIVVPNRRGVWARFDTTPFGHGLPYSRSQLGRLLSDALFTAVDWSGALHLPPIERRLALNSALTAERFGNRLWPVFAGIIIVEAKKELIAPIGRVAPAHVGKPEPFRLRLRSNLQIADRQKKRIAP